MGLEERAKGTRRVGETTEFLYIDQTHEEMDPEKSVLDFVSGGAQHLDVNGRRIYVPAYLEKLLFNMDSVRAPMGNLSGGERNRIELAKKLLRGGNFLVLDEPTNDLDLPTLRLLEESIGTFDGCALIVSHDRYFLNRVCTHIVSFQDDGELLLIVGDYDDYLRVRRVRDEGEFEKAATTPRAAATPAPAKESVQKLSYQDKQDLANMDALIETAENEVGEIEALMNEPDFYEQDYERVQAALAECDAAKAEVARLYQRWEDLETRRLDGA
jgi:ATP-binding cassette subfamily F protein uup